MSTLPFPVRVDTAAGRVLLRVPQVGSRFLVASTVAQGIGSSALRLDRGQPGEVRLVRWERGGGLLHLVQESKHHRGAGSFADSVLWSVAPLTADDGHEEVDLAGVAGLDLQQVTAVLSEGGHGRHTLRREASWVDLDGVRSGPDGLLLPLRAVFDGPGTSPELRRVVPDARSVALRVAVTFLPLPGEGFRPRRFHPASGSYGKGHDDHARVGAGVEVRWQPRFRLVPGGPVVFHVDPSVPQPWRDAVVEGGRWWRQVFTAVGLPDAVDVRVRAPDVEEFGPRTSTVSWVHRAGRGWSMGGALTDPRTQEVLRGQVRLGSQRVDQLTLLGEALLTPYDRPDEAQRLAEVREFVLARLRHLAAHEIGHALGFMHDYASTTHPRPSVMDYPHPRLRLTPDGARVDLTAAYSTGPGPWDEFLVRHAYGEPADGEDEEVFTARLRAEARAAGLVNVSEPDGDAPGAAHPDGVPWTTGADPFAELDLLLRVRRKALAQFGRGALAPDRQVGDLEPRLVVLHLLHRHQVSALARLLGGVRYDYAEAGDPVGAAEPVPTVEQERAVDVLLELLTPAELEVPQSALAALLPPPVRSERAADAFASGTGPVADPLAAVVAATSVVVAPLLQPARLARAHQQHPAGSPLAPGVLPGRLLDAAWGGGGDAGTATRTADAAGWTVVQHVGAALTAPELTEQVAAEVAEALAAWVDRAPQRPAGRRAAQRARRFLDDPAAHPLPAPPAVPPGVPW